MTFSSIAIRSLKSEPKRYIMLFIAATVGISLAITSIGLMNGMMNALHNKARIYYGGDLILMEGNSWSNVNEAIDKIEPYFNEKGYMIAPRFEFFYDQIYFNFEGVSVKQRKIKGIDFNKEKDLFKSFSFIEGSANVDSPNSVLISLQLAKLLQVHEGDNITLLVKTTQNYTNTANLVVQGIFQDSSVFGSNISYMDIDFLREITGTNQNFAHTIGIFSGDKEVSNVELAIFQKELTQFFDMYPPVVDKKEFLSTCGDTSSKVAIINLDASMQDIAFLISAMHIIIYIIIAILIIIIAIGIGSTYKVIAVKRTNEIGMYMALGLKPSGIVKIFVIEVFYLISMAFVASFVLTFILSILLGMIDFTRIPAFDMFLINGSLMIQPSILQVLSIYLIITVTTMALVYFTIRRYVKINPVDALNVAE